MTRKRTINKLSWVINSECNLNCVHCYPSSDTEPKKKMEKDFFDYFRANTDGVKFKRIFVSGGEPILDRQFLKYVELAKELGDKVFICSNGTLLTSELVTELASKKVAGIVLSLQALSESECLEVYGVSDIFCKVKNIIPIIQKCKLDLSIEMTIMKHTYQNIEKFVSTFRNMGVNSFSFKRLVKVGRACMNDVELTPEENYKALIRIFNLHLQSKDISINVHDPLYGTLVYDYYKDKKDLKNYDRLMSGYSCRAGARWIGIDPSGNVSPCPLMLYQGIIIGNVLEKPLIKILDESKTMLQLQESRLIGDNTCKYGAVCFGCKVASIEHSGNMFAKDPMCIFEDCKCPAVKREVV